MKPTLYFIPGTMCTEAVWAPVAERVAHAFEPVHLPVPVAPDLPATVAALAAAIPEPGARVVGFSLGAYLASALAVAHPGTVGRLMLVSSTPGPLVPAELKQRRVVIDWVSAHGYKGLSRAKAQQLVGESAAAAAIIDTVLAMDAALGGEVFLHQMRVTTSRQDLGPDLARAGIPVELAFSEADPLLDADWRRRFAALAPHAGMHEVPGNGHLLPLTHPDWLADLLLNWQAPMDDDTLHG
jgi:pimeloyl-ACP methyl ester carboxylesterase